MALSIAVTGLAAFVTYLVAGTAASGSALYGWSILAVLRILVAPLFALDFLVSVLFAPTRTAGVALLVATGIEAAVFACFAFILLNPFQSD